MQREGRECEELVRITANRWKLECREEVNGMLGDGKKSGIINRGMLYDIIFKVCIPFKWISIALGQNEKFQDQTLVTLSGNYTAHQWEASTVTS